MKRIAESQAKVLLCAATEANLGDGLLQLRLFLKKEDSGLQEWIVKSISILLKNSEYLIMFNVPKLMIGHSLYLNVK